MPGFSVMLGFKCNQTLPESKDMRSLIHNWNNFWCCGSLKLSLPTGGPAGTTHFLSGRVDGGALTCFATPSCSSCSTLSSPSRGKGTWCTRRWDPSDGRGTFWNAMWGFGFSYSTGTINKRYEQSTGDNRRAHLLMLL